MVKVLLDSGAEVNKANNVRVYIVRIYIVCVHKVVTVVCVYKLLLYMCMHDDVCFLS